MNDTALEAFLKRNCLTAENYDMAAEIGAFRGDMLCGLAGEAATLPMIPTFLAPVKSTAESRRIIAIDAGGTNLRTGVVTVTDGKVTDVEFTKCRIPGTDRELTNEEFYDAVAQRLVPYLDQSDAIGFCFSYAAECMDNGDARLYRFCKEVKVSGAEGKLICAELLAAIRRLGVTGEYRCVQLNDTVATMLGGMAVLRREDYDGFIGFILGTGINACYVENTAGITKYHGTGFSEEQMIVNMESGIYGGFARGPIDERIDAASAIPGDHMAEKMLGGAYLGKIIAEAMQDAAAEGFLQSALPRELREIPTMDVDAFLAGQPGVLDTLLVPEDRQTVRRIILSVYGRTARLMAVMLASVALHTGCGREKPMCVVLEGSTYHKSPMLQKAVAAELRALKLFYGISFEIVNANNQTLAGAAYAALPRK